MKINSKYPLKQPFLGIYIFLLCFTVICLFCSLTIGLQEVKDTKLVYTVLITTGVILAILFIFNEFYIIRKLVKEHFLDSKMYRSLFTLFSITYCIALSFQQVHKAPDYIYISLFLTTIGLLIFTYIFYLHSKINNNERVSYGGDIK